MLVFVNQLDLVSLLRGVAGKRRALRFPFLLRPWRPGHDDGPADLLGVAQACPFPPVSSLRCLPEPGSTRPSVVGAPLRVRPIRAFESLPSFRVFLQSLCSLGCSCVRACMSADAARQVPKGWVGWRKEGRKERREEG